MSGYKINFNQDFSAPDLSQFGLIGSNQDDDENDSDLEAELAALTAGQSKSPVKKPKTKTVVKQSELDRMVAESLKDINDDDISDDDDDPNLLSELQELTGDDVPAEEMEESQNEEIGDISPKVEPTTTTSMINLLNQRIEMYKTAEENAKATNEASRVRRFNRALKTLQDLLKQAKAGKTINNEDIPPEIAIKTPPSQADNNANEVNSTSPEETPTSPVITPTSSNDPPREEKIDESSVNPKLAQLRSRQQEYKIAALQAKRNDEIENAKQFVQIIKQFDAVIKMAENGESVDLSDMPPPPNQLKEFLAKLEAGGQPTTESEPPEVKRPAPPPPLPSPESEPKNLIGALEHRLNIYKAQEEAAKSENNSSKARRFGRIVKQYQDAITMHKRGKPFAADELPIPPGYGALPTSSGQGSTASTGANTPAESTKNSPVKSPSSAKDPDNMVSNENNNNKKTPPKRELTTRISGNQVSTNLAERQMMILLQRQAEFKKAAIEAKKGGELEQAKEYLKIYKGFESLLNAASNGLPVDLSTLPIPPTQRGELEDSFAIVSTMDCDDKLTGEGADDGDEAGMSIRLEEQLAKQLMMCKNTRDHHRAMGDVAGMNRFENLALTVQKELDLIRFSRKKNFPIPKFHYEKRSFNIVHCNTDLNDNEIEVNIIRGISYNVTNPKDVDTYIRTEFPYPIDAHFTAKTATIKNTASPDYDQKYIIEIQRSNRQCQRIFKRQSVKFDIYSKGGFFRSDTLIGTVNVKLQQLETKCEIHDTYNVMDGRKATGGKLEIKIRLRNPILTKQIEKIDEKWLVLDI